LEGTVDIFLFWNGVILSLTYKGNGVIIKSVTI